MVRPIGQVPTRLVSHSNEIPVTQPFMILYMYWLKCRNTTGYDENTDKIFSITQDLGGVIFSLDEITLGLEMSSSTTKGIPSTTESTLKWWKSSRTQNDQKLSTLTQNRTYLLSLSSRLFYQSLRGKDVIPDRSTSSSPCQSRYQHLVSCLSSSSSIPTWRRRFWSF